LSVALRLLVLSTLGLTALALVVGSDESRSASWRQMQATRPIAIDHRFLSESDQSLWVLDAESGAIQRHELPAREQVEHASVSPWRDSDGQWQVAGCWTRHSGRDDQIALDAVGLVRVSLPDGEILDRVETTHVPITPPCWYPGTRARVLFAAMDGRLYQYNFEGREVDRAAGPTPITWRVPGVDPRGLMLSSPCWPSDPRFQNILVVGVKCPGKEPQTEVSELWWLRLDETGGAIVAGGRLGTEDDGRDASTPAVLSVGNGPLRLAYLSTRAGETRCLVALRGLECDPVTGNPRVLAMRGEWVCEGSWPDPPVISFDGKRLVCLIPIQGQAPLLIRRGLEGLARPSEASAKSLARGDHAGNVVRAAGREG
jgi:hypothetical protein